MSGGAGARIAKAGLDEAGLGEAGMLAASRGEESPRRIEKSPQAFRTISEVAQDLEVPPHVLRFWETKFSQVRPLKRGGGRRYYRPEDVELLRRIRALLYREGYTIKGVQRLLREGGHALELAEARRGPGPAVDAGAEPEAPADAATMSDEHDSADFDTPPWSGPEDLPAAAADAPAGGLVDAVPAAEAAAETMPAMAPAAAAAREGEWKLRLHKVLVDLRTVREVLQRELQQPHP